jgi:hypothetical protein
MERIHGSDSRAGMTKVTIACPAHHRRNRGVEARNQRHECDSPRHMVVLLPSSVGRTISVVIDTGKGAA